MKREIVIQRNIIENMFMAIKEFIIAHRKLVLFGFLGAIVLLVVIVAFEIYRDKITTEQYYKYNTIMKTYEDTMQANPLGSAEKAAGEILKVADMSMFGYVHANGKYLAAGLYLKAKKYDLALKNFQQYADESSSKMVPYARFQSGVCAEWLGDNDKALSIYTAMEKDYKKENIMDRVYYDMARLYQKKKDTAKAIEYFNKVKTLYPDSIYAQLAKKRIYTMNASAE